MQRLQAELMLIDAQFSYWLEKEKQMYEDLKETLILNYIRHDVKEGDKWLLQISGDNIEELRFIEIKKNDIVFWNMTRDRKVVFAPQEFLNLRRVKE